MYLFHVSGLAIDDILDLFIVDGQVISHTTLEKSN